MSHQIIKNTAKEIVKILEAKLAENKTRTMTFTEDGLELAIKMIKDVYKIEG